MTKESIVLYARVIKEKFQGLSVIQIANILSYKVIYLNTDFKFLTANTYRHGTGEKVICINSKFTGLEKNVLCAHELGHAILNHPAKNTYKDKNLKNEHEANLFAVSLLFNEDDFIMPIEKMDNYTLQCILDENISSI